VTLNFSLTVVTEGMSRLIVPADHRSSGPSSARMPVFYNPQMEFSRDFSVALLSNILMDGDSFLDGLAAAGCRGVRVARECGKRISLHLNDLKPEAVELIRRNLELNRIADATVTQLDLRQLLISRSFNCVDVDPFGSPAAFFPMAIGAVRNNGILCVTATDTGTISGVFRNACLRKYGCKAYRTTFFHEIGVRNLVGFIAREAAKIDIGITPIASFYADHYVRTFVRIKKGAHAADEALRKLGYCVFDRTTLDRWYSPDACEGSIGPIWIDSTSDPEILASLKMPRMLRSVERIMELKERLISESRINRPFFDVDEFSRRLKRNPLPMEKLLSRLNDIAFTTRTHYGPKTFTTSANVKEIIQAFL
jgi:tRNA (guanine26-N2/guanine27-N2)-dimethyltransferase